MKNLSTNNLYSLFPVVKANRGKENKKRNMDGFIDTLQKHGAHFNIQTDQQKAHFIAQVAHESDEWNAYREYASGKNYEGRKDLGNIHPGDGIRFAGRGGIQVTGRDNYKEVGRELAKLPFLTPEQRALFENDGLLKNPKLLEDPFYGTLASMIFWKKNGLDEISSKPDNVKVKVKRYKRRNNKLVPFYTPFYPVDAISFKTNGGFNGMEDRRKFYYAIKKKLI